MFHQIVVHRVIFISLTIDHFKNRSHTLALTGSTLVEQSNSESRFWTYVQVHVEVKIIHYGNINVTQFESTSSIITILCFLFFSYTKKAGHKLIIIF